MTSETDRSRAVVRRPNGEVNTGMQLPDRDLSQTPLVRRIALVVLIYLMSRPFLKPDGICPDTLPLYGKPLGTTAVDGGWCLTASRDD